MGASPPLARCPASGSIAKTLLRASSIVYREFGSRAIIPAFRGKTCLSLREEWKEWTDSYIQRVRKRNYRTYIRCKSALKSCQRLFDIACPVCDKESACKARAAWQEFVARDVTHEVDRATFWSADPLSTLKARVRELVGNWGEGLRKERPVYIPDQQGCLENERNSGGTFGVSPSEMKEGPNIVRVGVAKTKGKHRVVTMQSARTKEILSPIHETLYDYLSSSGWVVRGEVTTSDFETIAKDRRPNESYISGDYENATNNIYVGAVEAIVDVLCESKHLTAMEVETLRGSFQQIRWKSCSGKYYPVKRGSMMGNLISFPILCLLNKACHDICRDYEHYWNDGERNRRVRINGDDIMFCGTRSFMTLWRDVTSHFGLVVNEEKTGFSSRFLELNSRSYDVPRHRLVAKPCLSFLQTKEKTGDLLSQVVKGCVGLSNDVLMYIINDLLRYEISIREIVVGNIPGHLWRSLIKRKWFRMALFQGPLPLRKKGEARVVPTLVAEPPRPRFYDQINQMHRDETEDLISKYRGKKIPPPTEKLDRSLWRERREQAAQRGILREIRFDVGEKQWGFTWSRRVYRFVQDGFDAILSTDKEAEWLDDHPRLVVRQPLLLTAAAGYLKSSLPPPPVLLQESIPFSTENGIVFAIL